MPFSAFAMFEHLRIFRVNAESVDDGRWERWKSHRRLGEQLMAIEVSTREHSFTGLRVTEQSGASARSGLLPV